MGFALQADIFGPRAAEQDWFRGYPVQATVLFRPSDNDMSLVMREQFTGLSRLTGDSLAFFTLLDPPKDWLEDARRQSPPMARRPRPAPFEPTLLRDGLTLDDSTVVHEVARRFGVRWDDLPVLIASSDLWSGEFVVAGSDSGVILEQIEALTWLVRRSIVRPTVRDIREELAPLARGGLLEVRSPGEAEAIAAWSPTGHLVERLTRQAREGEHRTETLASSLQTMEAALGRPPAWIGPETAAAWRSLAAEAERVRAMTHRELARARAQHDEVTEFLRALTSSALEWLRRILRPRIPSSPEDLFGDLLMAAIRAQRDAGGAMPGGVRLPAGLDEESTIHLQGAVLVASLLRHLNRLSPVGLDLSYATVGIRKAVEKEVNRSLVQAARKARGIPMPAFFLQWYPAGSEAKIDTGTDRHGLPRQVDLNSGPPLAFLSIGEVLFAVHAMLNTPGEQLREVIEESLGCSLPPRLLDGVSAVNKVCNRAVHTGAPPFSSQQFDDLWNRALSPELLGPLCRLSSVLSSETPVARP